MYAIRSYYGPNAERMLYVFEGFRRGMSVDEIYELSKIDKWFLYQFEELAAVEKTMDISLLTDSVKLREVKADGFSDAMIAEILNKKEGLILTENDIYNA